MDKGPYACDELHSQRDCVGIVYGQAVYLSRVAGAMGSSADARFSVRTHSLYKRTH